MAVAWDSDIPFYAERGSFTEKPSRNINSFTPDVGPPLENRASSFASVTMSFAMVMSNTEWDALLAYYRDDLGDGSLVFGPVTHPRNGTTIDRCKFVDEPSARDAGHEKNRISVTIRTYP